MPKVTVDINCGNSPKMAFLRDVNIAFAEMNLDYLSDAISDDVEWDKVGHAVITGKQNFMDSIKAMAQNPIDEMTIHTIITHGKEGAVNGDLLMADGTQIQFCDVYHFTSAKGNCIRSIKSYVIEVDFK